MPFTQGNVQNPTGDFLSFLQQGPTALDFARRKVPEQIAHANDPFYKNPKNALASQYGTYASAATPFSSSILPFGFSTLGEILAGQGKTDPALMNRNLADISRTTQGRQDALTGTLAAQGLSRSLGGAALNQAVGQAGSEQRAGALAAETAKQEQQKRSDLELMYRLLIDPALQSAAISQGAPRGAEGPSSTDQILSLLAQAGGAYLLSGCWVAAEVFDGWDDPRTHAARRYILTKAPKWFRDGYLRHGQAVAEKVRRDPRLRDQLRPLFLAFAQAGR